MNYLYLACFGIAAQVLCACTLIYDSKPIPADGGQDMTADSDVSTDNPPPDADADPVSDDMAADDTAPVDPPLDDGTDDRVDAIDVPADDEPVGPCGRLILDIPDTFFTVSYTTPVDEIALSGMISGFTCLRWEFDMLMPHPEVVEPCHAARGLSEAAAGGRLLGAAYMVHMRENTSEECIMMEEPILSARCWYDPPDEGTWLITAANHQWETNHAYHVSMELTLESLTVTLSDGGIDVGPSAVLDITEAGFTCTETENAFLRFGIGPEVTGYTAYTGAEYSNLQVWALACP